ncbi:hypothetical protein [Pelagicoccus sp. SDUM812003]|uniref:hypothetical protein n=1 Tax=Pelagicoccus sp. SDUM812003 TaxID=3041267 RepID=UPI00280EAEDE|nr:hypothetical protein [Pelagicoccus sp. SDUM812003]MDQ8204388.1 hypothetical protein [Pelagicoccus sp. SDUM812003]
MREYYIRREGDEDSSGPFDIDQIASLIEAGKLDASAYYYDIETENWLLISSNQEMMDTLFPKKRKLSLRTQEVEERRRLEEEEAARKAEEEAAADQEADATAPSDEQSEAEDGETEPAQKAKSQPKKKAKDKEKKKLKKEEEEKPEKLEVTKMLALAEGRADDPSGRSPREKRAAVAFFGLRFLTVLFIGSILAMGFIERELVMSADVLRMAKSPYLVVAAFDLLMVVFLLLQVTEAYPLLRFRAAVGAGLLTMLFYSSGDTVLLISNLLLMAAIYLMSAIVKIRYLIVCTVVGAIGLLGYVYEFFLN